METVSEKHVRLAAKLYEMRDTARRLWGDKYDERVRSWSKPIRDAQAIMKIDNPLTAATEICKCIDDAYQKIFLMAAAVEMVEPSFIDNAGDGSG